MGERGLGYYDNVLTGEVLSLFPEPFFMLSHTTGRPGGGGGNLTLASVMSNILFFFLI